jgi:transposase
VEVRVRRFFCRNGGCEKKVFAEPLARLAARYARRTRLANGLLTSVALALGGRAGARLAGGLAIPANRMTLIRAVRRVPDPVVVTPSVLGVDDFATRRGHRYATILIDMHTHRPIDVLPDRDADTLATWLRAHPGVGMICRDRGGSYAEGANRAIPGVPQVADRWHLLHNLSGHVEKAVAKHRRCLRPSEPEPPTPPPPGPSSPSRRESNTRARWAQVHELKTRGLGTHIIARHLGMDPKTVRRYADVESPDDLLGPSLTGRRSLLDPFKPHLQTRIDDGVTATSVLLREIRARGYRGGERTLRRWLIDARGHLQKPPTPPPVPSSRTITGWIMRPAENLNEDDTTAIKDACTRCADIAAITELAHGFTQLVRQRQGTQLEDWITKACAGPIAEIRGFANGLRKDFDAVKAGLTLARSSGAVEGAVNRVKMVKRQMFGRANFDLLPVD